MAFRAAKNIGLTLLGGGRRSFSTPTTSPDKSNHSTSSILKGDLAPIYVLWGMVVVALGIGSHTAFQQLARSPTVHVNKKRRETMPEASEPDHTIKSAGKFIDGSWLRKIAHVQDTKTTLHDPIHPNPFTRSRDCETLKTVGVEPTRR